MLTIDQLRQCPDEGMSASLVDATLKRLGYASSIANFNDRNQVIAAYWLRGPFSLTVDYARGERQGRALMLPAADVRELGEVLARHARLTEKGKQGRTP